MKQVYRTICKALLLIGMFLYYNNVHAQVIIKDTYLDNFASTYVKSLDEFIQRFNGKEYHPDLVKEGNERVL